MRPLEISLLVASGVTITIVFAAALLRGRGIGSGKLSPPMVLFIRISLGIVFAILGVVGSLLPILQGWIFFLIAALLLFPKSRFAVKALDKIAPRMPRLAGWFRHIGIGTPEVGDDESDTMRAP